MIRIPLCTELVRVRLMGMWPMTWRNRFSILDQHVHLLWRWDLVRGSAFPFAFPVSQLVLPATA